MKRSRFTSIVRESWNDLLDSLDMRQRPHLPVLQRGQTVTDAWQATGGYLRKAISDYAKANGRPSSRR